MSSESTSSFADARDDVVHCFRPTAGIPGTDTRHVCTDTITIPVLVYTAALEAGDELVLLVPEVHEKVGAGTVSKRPRQATRR